MLLANLVNPRRMRKGYGSRSVCVCLSVRLSVTTLQTCQVSRIWRETHVIILFGCHLTLTHIYFVISRILDPLAHIKQSKPELSWSLYVCKLQAHEHQLYGQSSSFSNTNKLCPKVKKAKFKNPSNQSLSFCTFCMPI